MGHDTGLAERIRAAGVRVVEVDGWPSRGSSSFTPRGAVCHHTAGPSSGTTPSLSTVIYGRPDLAGPLCAVLQSREANPADDAAYVVAGGRANHAGEGGWQGLSGNSSVYGLEIEHTGVDPLGQTRQEVAAAIIAAMIDGLADPDPALVCQHREWASGRKIDAAENVDADAFRNLVAAYLGGRYPGFGGDDVVTPEDREAIAHRCAQMVGGAAPQAGCMDLKGLQGWITSNYQGTVNRIVNIDKAVVDSSEPGDAALARWIAANYLGTVNRVVTLEQQVGELYAAFLALAGAVGAPPERG